MNVSRSLLATLTGMALLGLLSGQALAKPPASTVTVDCTKGQSINAALTNSAPTLVVEIRGFCDEDVLVTRDQVTLRGADPALDGIRGVAPAPPNPIPPGTVTAALTVRDGDEVIVENLTVSNGALNGIAFFESNAGLVRNCRLVANNSQGLHVSAMSFVTVTGSEMSGNPDSGLRVQRSSNANIDTTTISGGNIGLAVTAGGNAFMVGGSISGVRGLVTNGGGQAVIEGTPIVGTGGVAVSLFDAAAQLSDLAVTGALRASNKSRMLLFGVQQTGGGSSVASLDSLIDATDGTSSSSLQGNYTSASFSQVMLEGGTTLSGNLNCNVGGNAFCFNPAAISGTVSGCGVCVKP